MIRIRKSGGVRAGGGQLPLATRFAPQMRNEITRACLVSYAVLLVCSVFLLSGAGGKVPVFLIMTILGLPPVLLGSRRQRRLG